MTSTDVNLRFAATLLRDAYAMYPEMRGVGIGVKNNKPCLRIAVTEKTDLIQRIPVAVAGVPVMVFDVSKEPLPAEQRPAHDVRLHLLSEHGRGEVLWLPENEAEVLHRKLHEQDGDSDDLSWDYARAHQTLVEYRDERGSTFDAALVLEQYFHHR